MPKDPIVIDPSGFSQDGAWEECREFVARCGGLSEDNLRMLKAASGADPGVCSCPVCREHYWAWGRKQKCVECGFVYPTDWWPMYSYGVQARESGHRYKFEERMRHPYYRYGFENPVESPIDERSEIDWKKVIV